MGAKLTHLLILNPVTNVASVPGTSVSQRALLTRVHQSCHCPPHDCFPGLVDVSG